MVALSDSTKKWSVLIPTALLPTELRVKSRRSMLAKLELEKAESSQLLIIGHPKSGNTWLRVMVSRLYGIRHGLPDNLIAHSDEMHRRNPAIPRIAATNGHYSYEGEVGKKLALGAADNSLRHKPAIFLARNPLDVAVSWFFQFTKRQSKQKQELINHWIEHPIDRNAVTMWDFVRHSDIGLLSLIDYMNDWERNIQALPKGKLMSYEALRTDPGTFLKQLGEHMGDPFSEDEIKGAVEFGAYDNLKALESQGHFKQGGMVRRNPGDPNSAKVRRGKINGYRDYFTPEQVVQLEALVNERLSPTLGYTPIQAVAA